MALASSAVLRLRQACKAISTYLRGDFHEPLAPPDRDEERLHFAVADYPSPTITTIGDRNTSRYLQLEDRFARAALAEKHDTGGPECLAHGKQLFWRGETATTLKFANIGLTQIALGPEVDPRPVQQGPSRRHLLWR
ncbi:hypothetical protein [Mesorhizobium argentiipisi]|uniref:RES domain-containing protein n=1 Tax=Mesorhizobium argentiipisi TaxID=3015175 RepID=A0ABU8KKX9_9HYPH